MSAADEITAAADKLRKLIADLPVTGWGARPWHVEECSDTDDMSPSPCPCIVAQGEYHEFDQPQDPLIQYVADAETVEHCAYIATMHPGVGAALASWLESWTGIEMYEAHALPEDARHALAVARAINGTAS
ncbi:hypothetical protein SUDANB1_07132 [Streptomyces sp. enrichment culture]|uniref:hypothetical protein n=1 Tax=Streptomyces sp. enrichment culture TaxID=1795815 RepID=UPI003F550E5C